MLSKVLVSFKQDELIYVLGTWLGILCSSDIENGPTPGVSEDLFGHITDHRNKTPSPEFRPMSKEQGKENNERVVTFPENFVVCSFYPILRSGEYNDHRKGYPGAGKQRNCCEPTRY